MGPPVMPGMAERVSRAGGSGPYLGRCRAGRVSDAIAGPPVPWRGRDRWVCWPPGRSATSCHPTDDPAQGSGRGVRPRGLARGSRRASRWPSRSCPATHGAPPRRHRRSTRRSWAPARSATASIRRSATVATTSATTTST